MEYHEKALQERETELRLQERAAKKTEIGLKALIRQMQNKDAGKAGS